MAIWGLTGREGGAEAGWHEHIWRQAVSAAGGWTAFLAHAYACASPEELGSWPASRRGAIWKVCGLLFIYFARLYQNKRSEKEKKIGKENLGKGSHEVHD